EHHLVRHLDRRAERARALGRALLEVEVDVLLRGEVDAELAQAPLERGQHPLRREGLVPFRGTEESRYIPCARLGQADAEPLTEESVAGLLPQPFRRVQHLGALRRELVETEAEALVELVVVRRPEL